MIIKAAHILNYRCISDETLLCDDLTALVGANGAGKSTFLQAINLFYAPVLTVEEEDFYQQQTGDDITITITFGNLSPEAKTQFAKYLETDGTLVVSRIFQLNGRQSVNSYHGSRRQHVAFKTIRQANATEAKNQYKTLRANSLYDSLPNATTQAAVLTELETWEGEHPDLCERLLDEGNFFGFKAVGTGYLGKYTRFILVPAVRDAAPDGEEGKDSLFTQLINLVVRSNTAGNEDIDALGKEVSIRYKQILAEKKEGELGKLGEDMAKSLGMFVGDSDVQLSWAIMPDLQLPPPKAIAKLVEEGHVSSVERKGHGLQRAFIMMLLQFLESARSKPAAGGPPSQPDLMLGIEEPELYQHPDRQRHIAGVLRGLALISVTAEDPSTQVMYTTHSPYFVGLDRFNNIRLARKQVDSAGKGLTTKLAQATLGDIAKELATVCKVDSNKFTSNSLQGRLVPLMTPWMNEGFFADLVVLVEGEQDRAAIVAAARQRGKDLDGMGIAVIPCLGKNNIDRPALIFRAFGIPTYIVFDSDQGKKGADPEANRRLLRVLGMNEEDYPSFVRPNAACCLKNLETTLWDEMDAAVLEKIITDLQTEFEVDKDDLLKNSAMMTELLTRASRAGQTSKTLDGIVEAILAIRQTVKPRVASS